MGHYEWNPELIIPFLALLIPLVAIIGGLLVKAHRLQLQHETLRQLAESGQPIPQELLEASIQPTSKAAALRAASISPGAANAVQLRTGAINVGAGIGLMVMFYFMQGAQGWLWAIGAIPFCIGVAMLVVWKIERGTPPAA